MATSAWGREESFWSVLEKNYAELQKKHILLHQFLQTEIEMLLSLEMVLHWIRELDLLYVTEKRTKNVDLFCSRCGKHICPEHSDIVYINCDKFDITVAIVIIFVCVYLQVFLRFMLLFLFICKWFGGLCKKIFMWGT